MDENKNIKDVQPINPIFKSLIKSKLKFYSTTSILVHLKLINGQFRNAYIMNEAAPGIWCVNERKLGICNIFEEEITSIEDYAQKEKIKEIAK